MPDVRSIRRGERDPLTLEVDHAAKSAQVLDVDGDVLLAIPSWVTLHATSEMVDALVIHVVDRLDSAMRRGVYIGREQVRREFAALMLPKEDVDAAH